MKADVHVFSPHPGHIECCRNLDQKDQYHHHEKVDELTNLLSADVWKMALDGAGFFQHAVEQ